MVWGVLSLRLNSVNVSFVCHSCISDACLKVWCSTEANDCMFPSIYSDYLVCVKFHLN